MSLKVTIVVPIYNVEAFIIDCLDSITRQTYTNTEVIFIDDVGTDNSMQILKKYLSCHPFPNYKIIVHEQNRGLSAARNTGLISATGDYIYFLDSDDYISETCIETLTEPLNRKLYDVVIGSYQEFYNDKIIPRILNKCDCNNPLKMYSEGYWPVMAWNKLCNRKFLLKNNIIFKEGILHEDVPWSFQLACQSSSIYLSNQITYTYRIRNNSIITNMTFEKDIQYYLISFSIMIDFLTKKGLNKNKFIYQIIEGKKSFLLYNLLQNKKYSLYNKYYPYFYYQKYISPWKAYRMKMITFTYFLRDFHYCLPVSCGIWWKHLFYLAVYKLWKKKVE